MAIFPTLYNTSLNPSYIFHIPTLCCPPSHWKLLPCSLYLQVSFFFVLFTSLSYFLDSTHKQYHIVPFFLWLISLSIMLFKSIHVVANGKIFILFYSWVVSHIFSNHSSVDRHLGCFHILEIIKMLLWILQYMYLFKLVFSFFRYVPRSGTAG